jgi:hypothetical protein
MSDDSVKLIIITKDPEVVETAKKAFRLDEDVHFFESWHEALENCAGASLMFVDLVATLMEPNRIAGYEKFAHAKMGHPVASKVPLVLIAPPADYELDFMAGWPDFVFSHIRKPITDKIFRRVVTYI